MAADTPASGGIKVGDAVLAFIGDTSNLEQAWSAMEMNSKASATRTVNEVIKQYDKLGIEGSASLNRAMALAADSFTKLRDSGVASITDLIQAEQSLLEKSIALKQSLGQSIPLSMLERLESLKLQYIGITGTVKEFEAAQLKSVATLKLEDAALDRNSITLQRNKEASIAAALAKNEAAEAQLSSRALIANKQTGGGGAVIPGFGSPATLGALAIAAGLTEGAKASLEFGKNFAELTTLIDTKTPEGAKDVEMLKQQLLALNPALGPLPQLTRAAYEALSSNIPAAQVADLTAKTSVFAQATRADLFDSMKLATSAINAYGLEVKNTDQLTAGFFKTIQLGQVEGPELAANLGRVFPVAHNMGVSLNEVEAAIAAMTIGGLSADESVTALRQVLVSLQNPSKEARKAADELHISLSGIRQEIQDKGLNVALGNLAEKLQGNSQASGELFSNIRAQTGIMALAGPQAAQYADFLKQITQASKEGVAAQEAMDKVLASQQGQLSLLSNTIEHDFIVAWEKLLPVTNSFGRSLSDLLVRTGLLKIAGVSLAATLLTLATVLSATAGLVDLLKVGTLELAKAFVTAAGYATGLGTLSDNAKASISKLNDSIHENKKAFDENGENVRGALKAFDDLVRGTGGATTAQEQYAAAAKLKAQADQTAAFATREAAEAVARHKQELNDAAEKTKQLEEATKKTTKAMEQYANAHGIPLVKELQDGVSAAQKFAREMQATGQPTASAVAALINLNIQVGKLKQVLNDGRSIGQMLFDMGNGKNADGGKKLQDEVDKIQEHLAKSAPMIKDPMVDAFNAVLESEQRLGIEGTATLSKHVYDAEQSVMQLRKAFKDSTITAQELALAEAELARANEALSASFQTGLQKSIADALVAEKTLGGEGTQTLILHRNEAQATFDAIKAGAAKGVEGVHDVELAELKLIEADMKLKVQTGQPVPQATIQRFHQLADALELVKQKGDRAKQSQEDFYTFIKTHVPQTVGTFNLFKNEASGAFESFAGAFGNAVNAAVSGQKSIGEAMKEAVATTLDAIASQSAVYALYETALGFAALANPLTAYQAPGYFTAAAEYAAVAVVAGVAGAALGGGSSSRSGGSGGSSASVSSTPTGQVNPVNVQNVTRFGGGGLVTGRTLAMIGDSKTNPNKDATEAVIPLDDEQSMSRLRAGLGSTGGDNHFYIQGLVSPDTMDKVMGQMSKRVQAGTKLMATSANRVTRKS